MKQRGKANRLGDFIYKTREEKGISTPKLAKAVGVHHSAIARIQLGEIKQPRPALLARIAEELDVSSGELYALADYRTEDDLPDLRGWLHIKHRALPDDAVETLQGHLDYLVDRHASDVRGQDDRSEAA